MSGQEFTFRVPITDAALPLTHLMLGASAMLVDHLEENGLCAKSAPLWTVLHAQQVLETKIKVVNMPAESAPVDLPKRRFMACPECKFEFAVM